MPPDCTHPLLDALVAIALEAGRLVLKRQGAGEVAIKADGSPQTQVDRAADALIVARLAEVAPAIPAVSEEGSRAPPGACFFLVDALDGTREYMAGRDEFTINLALVADGRPEIGVVLAPAFSEIFVGFGDRALTARATPDLLALGEFQSLQLAGGHPSIRAVASRSHLDDATRALLERLGVTERQHYGSALKFCRLAQGLAELYPRLAPTMEWDTAAGEAVLVGAGGAVLGLTGRPLAYGRPDAGYCNEPFVAAASRGLAERAVEAAAATSR